MSDGSLGIDLSQVPFEPYYMDDYVTLYCGDNMQKLVVFGDEHFSSVVTDPPYGLSFMGKKWDYDVPSVDLWEACMRVLKPGGHLLAFAGTRTQHRMAVRIEDAGFEIRDMIAWVYGSGFPKSLDVSKAIDKAAGVARDFLPTGSAVKRMIPGADQNASGSWIKDSGREYQPGVSVPATDDACKWKGWGTALKPALEPISVARKPLIGTVAENVLKHGSGAINVDGCRVDGEPWARPGANAVGGVYGDYTNDKPRSNDKGRWPANLIHDGSDEVVALFPMTKSGAIKKTYDRKGDDGWGMSTYKHRESDEGCAARFFYCAKASDREIQAAEKLPLFGESFDSVKNTHPTVKPVDLMRYLVRLVTPPGGIVLDPFAGSGTTLVAAKLEGRKAVGIEVNPEYCEIAKKRLEQGVLF